MLFKFLFRNLKGLRGLVILAIIITFTQVGADLIAALPIKFIPSKISDSARDPACDFPFLDPVLDLFDNPALDPELAKTPSKTQPCKNDPTISTSHSTVGVVIFSVVTLVIFGGLSAFLIYIQLFLSAYIAQTLTARLRTQLFEHLQRLSLDWHGKQKKGDLINRVIGNISDLEKFISDGLVDLLSGILTLIGVAIIMIKINPQYTLLSLAIAPALFMLVLGYTRSIKAASKKASKATGQVAEVASEDIHAVTVIRAFTLEEREDLRFRKKVGKNREEALRAGGLQAQFTPLVSVFVLLATALIFGVGGYVASGKTFQLGFLTLNGGSIDIGTLMIFLNFLKMLYTPMRDLSKLTNVATNATAGAERIQEILDQAPEVRESTVPYNGPPKLRGEITFENVFFGYSPEHQVLKGINLHIPAGRKVALVGLSGGGKTTLVKLIPRFYEIQQGNVKVDGYDNRMYPLNVLRNNVSMVLQDSVLFEGSIRENIEIGRPGASLEEIIDAAKKAHIHETILTMLGGYDRTLREQGKDLSGGQRQRMAIARAILRDAPILVLDEPTASLDVEAEAEVMRALDQLVVRRTVLMISHRLSTLGSVDEIIVLKDGRVVEQGSFRELRRRGGVFAGLLEEQNRYNVEKEGEKSIIRSAFMQVPSSPDQMGPSVPLSPYRPTVPIGSGQPPFPQGPLSMPIGQVPPPQRQRPPVGAGSGTPTNARVIIELDGKIIGERPLYKPVMTIGRLSGNDVQVPNQRVSRLHAKIRQENGVWVIEDADSVNGLVYQGTRIERLALTDGDRVHIAPTAVLHYRATI